jgi:cytochrome c biogenesis protein CcmG/thiol:disulfide interchange protein DsbE
MSFAQFFRRFTSWTFSLAVVLLGAVVAYRVVTGRLPPRQAMAAAQAAEESNMPAPSFNLPLADGTGSLALTSLKGKAVYLNFFASWCPPCNLEAPELAQIDRQYAGRGFVMIGLDEQESADRAVGFRNRYSLPYQIVLDQDGAVGTPYGASALPVQALIDRKGRIAWLHVGMVDAEEARQHIERTVAASP